MVQKLYRPQVRCEVSEGLTDRDITVSIRDAKQFEQFIHVIPTQINWYDDRPYLPVGIIKLDHDKRQVLIELPIEADSGANRMWMSVDDFLAGAEVSA